METTANCEIVQIATSVHDEIVYTSAAAQEKVEKVVKSLLDDQSRFMGMHAALGTPYGTSNWYTDRGAKGANARAESTYAADVRELPPEERRWAVAFRAVYKVSTHFYIKADAKEKRRLEEWALETAKLETAIGRKAAEVVVHRTMSALEGEKPEPKIDWMDTQFDMKQALNRHSRSHDDQMDAYRYMFGHNFPKQISGTAVDTIIVDEVSSMKRKKP